jgi:hypothetical protein
MVCPECDGERLRASVPEELQEHAPGEGAEVVACTNCLRTWAPGETGEEPAGDLAPVSDALPPEEPAAVGLVLSVSLLSSVAHNEATLAAVFDAVEAAGADPRLVMERLADDADLAPVVDLERRLHQFEGLR